MNTEQEKLLKQLEKYPRRKVELLTEYLFQFVSRKQSADSELGLLCAKDLSSVFGVSKVTALKVLEELDRRKQGAQTGREIRTGKKHSGKILVCISPLIENEVFATYNSAPFFLGRNNAVQYFYEQGFETEIISREQLDGIGGDLKGIAGLLLKTAVPYELQKKLHQAGIPAIEIHVGTIEPTSLHTVSSEFQPAFFSLLEKWRDRPEILLTTSRNRVGVERLESFRFCAEADGRPLESMEMCITPMIPGDLGQLAGYKFGLQLVETRKHPVILSASDYFSFGLVSAFMEKHWFPLEDYELVSIDNLERIGQCPFGKPFLSSIDFHLPEIHVEGARLLVKLINEKADYSALISRRLPAVFISRETA